MNDTTAQGDKNSRAIMHGRFITLEGGEGTGKSTQIQRLVARLAAEGIDTVATREPGGSPRAEKLREIILSGYVEPLGPVAETLAFSAARIDHIDKTIRPALEEGCFVVCDRFIDSTRAYQGALGDVDPALISQLETIVVGDTRPDLTIILDLPPETGLERAQLRRGNGTADRFEAEDLEFHGQIRQAFLKIAASEPDRCVRIFAGKSPDEVEADIWRAVKERLLDQRSASRAEKAQTDTDLHFPARLPRAPSLRVVNGAQEARSKPGGDGKTVETSGKTPESA